MRIPLLALPCLALALASCLVVSPPGATFASEPPGARVLVDGRDSGFVTPCLLALDTDESYVVTIALAGYESREFELVPHERGWFVNWRQAVAGVQSSTHFPLLMPAQDLLLPFRSSHGMAPGRVFARLHPERRE